MKIHLIGMGGIGMSGLARLLLAQGKKVSGTDTHDNEILAGIRRLGGEVRIGHAAANLDHPQVVVYSSSIPPANPEITAARNRGVPVLHRGQMLARLLEGKETVAVTGAHGKSTTTAMIGWLLSQAGLDPTVILGAEVEALGGNARLGKGRHAVVEADESDGSMLWLSPSIAIVTNMDEEHLDYFRNRREIGAAYAAFAGRVKPGGTLVACADDPRVRRLLKNSSRAIGYGLREGARYRATQVRLHPGGSRYRLIREGKAVGPVELRVPGIHNVVNSLAAAAAADLLQIDFKTAQSALGSYAGAKRRFQIHGEAGGVMVVEDYAHHPAEIQATLEAARSWGKRRIRCVFQPHRFTRTRYLMDRFAACFRRADEVFLLPVYAASESPIAGVDAGTLGREIRRSGQKRVRLVEPSQALAELKASARPGDMVLFLGAGSIGGMAAQFMKELRSRRSRRR